MCDAAGWRLMGSSLFLVEILDVVKLDHYSLIHMPDDNALNLIQQTVLGIEYYMLPANLIFLPFNQCLLAYCYINGRFRIFRPVIRKLYICPPPGYVSAAN